MPELGMSAYLSEYEDRSVLPHAAGNVPVFLSLHRPEEIDDHFTERMTRFTRLLHERNFTILADIDRHTFAVFKAETPAQLCQNAGVDGLRVDYGFSTAEVIDMARKVPVAVNASTLTPEDMHAIQTSGVHILAMHNYYPRPETGLDRQYLTSLNTQLHAYGIRTAAFIAGDGMKRGPLYMGLPTLEEHRNTPPYLSAIDLFRNTGCDEVFTGDPELSMSEEKKIRKYLDEDIISIPCELEESASYLYDRVWTERIDSPAWMIRFQEGRSFMKEAGHTPAGMPGKPRTRGTVTVDNEKYLRYQGELQILRKDFPADDKVNVIGHVKKEYTGIIDMVGRGKKFVLVRE